MIPTFDKVHNRFKLNNISFDRNDLKELAYSYIKEGEPFEKVIGNFVSDWLDTNDYILTKTSGSTGKPKTIKVKKQAMVNSAIATGDYFGLKPRDKALLCLPVQAISGKMMVVRAMMLGLELDAIKPSISPDISTNKKYHFCAFTPAQLSNSLKKIENIKTIIVGGAPISDALVNEIINVKSTVYETYGMTETVSHVAIKKLNKVSQSTKEKLFQVLPNVTISLDDRECLVIDAPHLSNNKIITNDVVRLIDHTSFKWIGRFDNVINSGGVKLYPEVIESKLQNVISERFFVISEPDEKLGEKLILVVEASKTKVFDKSVFKGLDKYEVPKKTLTVPKFVESVSGKIQRNKTLQLVK